MAQAYNLWAKPAERVRSAIMGKPLLRWVLILVCGLGLGPWALQFLSEIKDADGGHAATLLVGASPLLGVVKGLIVLLVAGGVGAMGAYFFSLGTGYTCAGLVLGWSAWGVSTLGAMAHDRPLPMTTLAIEGAGVTLAAGLIAAWADLISRSRQPTERKAGAGGWRSLLAIDADGAAAPKAAWGALGLGVITGGATVWFFAGSSDHGQVFVSVMCGAIAAGAAGQLFASAFGATLSPVTPILSMGAVALLGPIIAGGVHGAGLVHAIYAGEVLPLARPLSLQWAGGAMLGAPIGIGWAGAMLDVRAAEFGAAS